ncbi:hypothetical protein CC53_gp120 [Rhizobium phage vB_RleS_L338C]|uniref:hypothetical protein n=1 Tax=Rhizobium phage vB_RleS_L338C TaxID=1414737 RepID=UPI0003D8AA0B|nr:hypothetical protein CC53_gp120 [Rhizobium phage vB_RleS_L338C]AHC30537.1 hypothetical protein L338C_120 [Rhizobium phage vB_RleS_L338C]QNH72142.1 hypothetical protein P11VFA_030 [Rhizobium phage P11VFA]
MADESYIVLYRLGGWATCEWRRTANIIGTLERAEAEVASLERMGFKAIYRTQAEHDLIGFPLGWHWKVVDHAMDTINITPWESQHSIHPSRFEEVRALVERERLK